MIDSVAAIGDVSDINCWSGIPHHFCKAAWTRGLAARPAKLEMSKFRGARQWWNLCQLALGRGLGGYQYSNSFLTRAEAVVLGSAHGETVLTFNQHFPRGRTVTSRGGRMLHYIDATFASFCQPGGLVHELPAYIKTKALALERENFAASERIVTMGRWAAESVVRDCGVCASKVTTILPGANLTLPANFDFQAPDGRPGNTRPLVLGFIGKDWRRKGLPFLLDIKAKLDLLGISAIVRCAGNRPDELTGCSGLEYVGFIDKAKEPDAFLRFITGCDIGCLFSSHEPLGISTLEFLRAGIPVMGFTVEGLADTLPPYAGFRFLPEETAEKVAATVADACRSAGALDKMRAGAQALSPRLTWERCVDEWMELLATGTIKNPVKPWMGNTYQ